MGKVYLGSALAILLLAGCGAQQSTNAEQTVEAPQITGTEQDAPKGAGPTMAENRFDAAKLDATLAHPRRDDDRARDGVRHTAEAVEFFQLTPRSNVVEVLPGGGWYTRVLLPYVSPDGGWYGLNYGIKLGEAFMANAGREMTDEQRAERLDWPNTYPAKAALNGPEDAAIKGAFMFDAIPDEMKGKMDAVIYVRALHHLNRFDAAIFEAAIADTFDLLKPGGIAGVVQHRAREDYGDTPYDTSGNKGYVKQSYVVAMFEKGGFVLEETSEMNANPEDTADYEVGVWTLPPSLRGKDESMKEHYTMIGESDRMTLRFRKPQ